MRVGVCVLFCFSLCRCSSVCSVLFVSVLCRVGVCVGVGSV